MDKQTKQLVVLGVLVIVGGIVGAWQLGVFGGDEPTTPPVDPNAATATPTPTTPEATTPTTPGTPGAPAPVGVTQDLEIPEEVTISMPRYGWNYPNGGYEYESKTSVDLKTIAYDPLWVQNIDVVDPKRKEYIDTLKREWVLDGLIETVQSVTRDDGEGNKVTTQEPVLEAWFKAKNRPYGINDRLTNTRFTIEAIFKDRVIRAEGSKEFKVRSGVDLLGDTGAKLTIYVGNDERYEPDNK